MIGPNVPIMTTESTPICRCRVLYLGSSVPQQTKDGLQGIQEPLQELYPEEGATGARGIDSWLSVWSNGILLENVDENHKKVTRFFPIESLHYCAAVRYVLVPEKNTLHSPSARFLPLDSPFARAPNPTHPPLFAAILRRTTGIKVLECHAFICKREVAANALVRCCFHAYADSSYAKQVDTAGSIYGSLATERVNNGSKLEMGAGSVLGKDEWKMTRSRSGSTMTIDTLGHNNGTKDDVSVFNGDENHKVWAGSQDNLDGIYDVYSSSTISRPSRPRQIAQPIAAVPPPPSVKDGKKQKKSKAAKSEVYANGTLLKPRLVGPGPPPLPPPQPVYIVAAAPHPHHPPPPKYFKGPPTYHNTFSHRPRQNKVFIPTQSHARPIPMPVAPVIIPTPTPNATKQRKNHKKTMEEPIYMPSNRALSPIASYQPVNFPHEAYLMQHYATMEHPHKQKQKNGHHSNGGKSSGGGGGRKLAQAQSMMNLDDVNNDESPFNTGIYRKKGHLNERAFSYSIRQEHRSRSYGSLANLKFATPIPNGEAEEDIKKEREIMQMVHDLDLSGDDLERSEVPRQMYEGRGNPALIVASTPHVNGNGRSSRKF